MAILGVVLGAVLALVASSPLPGQRVSDERGLWVLTSDRLLQLGPAGELRVELALAGDFAPAGAQALSVDAVDGTVWLLGADRVLGYSSSGSLIARFPVSEIARSIPAAPVRFLAHGRRLWFGVGETLHVLDRRGELEATLLTGSPVRDLVAGRDAVWELTELDAQRFDLERFARTATLPIALEGSPRIAVDPRTDGLWIATELELEHYDAEGVLLLHREHDRPLAGLTALVPDHRGGLWMASGRRLVGISAEGEIAQTIAPLDPAFIHSLAYDPLAERLWLASDEEVASLRRSGVRSASIWFGPDSAVRALAFAGAVVPAEAAPEDGLRGVVTESARAEADDELVLVVADPPAEPTRRAAQICGGRFTHDLISGSGEPLSLSGYVVFDDGHGPALYTTHHEYIGQNLRGRLVRVAGDHWENVSEPFRLTTRALSGTGERPTWLVDIVVFDDGSGPAIYVGGVFDEVGEVRGLGSVARWDGRRWSRVGLGVGLERVLDLRVFDDGSGPALYAYGRFEHANWVSAWHGNELLVPVNNGWARWNRRAWSPTSPVPEMVTVRHPTGTEYYGAVTQPDSVIWVSR